MTTFYIPCHAEEDRSNWDNTSVVRAVWVRCFYKSTKSACCSLKHRSSAFWSPLDFPETQTISHHESTISSPFGLIKYRHRLFAFTPSLHVQCPSKGIFQHLSDISSSELSDRRSSGHASTSGFIPKQLTSNQLPPCVVSWLEPALDV